ncbi:MAG: hypothetical protein NZ602_03955 [Thermoguttaceae bacterium]|nr:hypothetical protein [Thermoguttaceae bacterium]MDW8038491.1 hypothetical protein [Thermoguttaceae bacterium]
MNILKYGSWSGWVLYCLGLLGLMWGCGGGKGRPEGELPKLQPVRGQLLRAGQPVSGGSLQLEPLSSQKAPASSGQSMQNLSIGANVKPDGGFEVVTLHTLSMKSAPGAPVGQYRVTYLPPASGKPEDQAAFQPITLPQPITIQEGQNELRLSLDQPPVGKR